jgi:hypothetical protein
MPTRSRFPQHYIDDHVCPSVSQTTPYLCFTFFKNISPLLRNTSPELQFLTLPGPICARSSNSPKYVCDLVQSQIFYRAVLIEGSEYNRKMHASEWKFLVILPCFQ